MSLWEHILLLLDTIDNGQGSLSLPRTQVVERPFDLRHSVPHVLASTANLLHTSDENAPVPDR